MKTSDPQEHDWDQLFVRYFDGALDDAEMDALEELLASEPEARKRFNDSVLQAQVVAESETELRASSPAADTVIRLHSARRRAFGKVAALAAGLVFLIGLGALLFVSKKGGDVIADLEITGGSVDVSGEVRSGQAVNTQGPNSAAVLTFRDGTRLVLSGNTALTVSEDSRTGKHVELHAGSLSASVEPQPAGRPMILVTDQAEIEVLGTEFSLATSRDADATGLGVNEGRVRLLRRADGKSIEVDRDRYVIASPHREFESRPLPPLPDAIDLSFEQGLPSGWVSGRLLPAEKNQPSRVVAEPQTGQPRGTHYQIFTQNAWLNGMTGLFTIHEDTRLNIRYRMKDPGFFQVFVGTRDVASPASRTVNFLGANLGRSDTPDQWRTLSFSLAEMKNLHSDAPPAGRFAIFLLLDTQEVDRGFELERVWVTRGLENGD